MTEGINLISDEIRRGRSVKRWKTLLAAAALLYLGLLGAVYTNQKIVLSGREAQLRVLEQEKAALVASNKEYARLIREIRAVDKSEVELKTRLEGVSALVSDHTRWSSVLKALTHHIPRHLWLRGLSSSDIKGERAGGGAGFKRLKFVGRATASTAVSEFIFLLENSRNFDDVNLTYSQKREYKTMALYDFEVTARFKTGG